MASVAGTSTQNKPPEGEAELRFRDIRAVGGGALIRADRIALSQLERYIREGVHAVRHHGVEVGGLVLGSPIDRRANELVITGFIGVEIEYSLGPTFRLSQADFTTFFKAFTAQEQGKVIGYFRSQLRDGLTVREEDLDLLAWLFPATDCCFVRIVANAYTPSVACHYVVKTGVAPVLSGRFPLKEKEEDEFAGSDAAEAPPTPRPAEILPSQADSAPAIGAVSAAPWPRLLEVPAPSFAESAKIPAIPAWRNWKRLVLVLVPVVAALVVAAVYRVEKPPAPAPIAFREPAAAPPAAIASGEPAAAPPAATMNDPGIDLHMIEHQGQVEVRWNSASPAVLTAVRGSLSINGGPRIDLNAVQVRSGLYSLKPVGNPLNFVITIYQADGSFMGDSGSFTRELRASESALTIPGKPETQPARGTLAEGGKKNLPAKGNDLRNNQVDAMRAEIPLLIQTKRWNDAQQRISELQRTVPGDSEAAAWQKSLTNLRNAELKGNAPAVVSDAGKTPVPSPQASSQETGKTTPVLPVETANARGGEKTVAALLKPAVAPEPVESAIPLPSSLVLPAVPAPVSAIKSPTSPAVADTQLASRIGTIAGHWAYSNPKARRPRITNGFQMAPEMVAVEVYPDGSGSLDFETKPGIWHVAETSVKFHFRLTGWDGRRLSGKSENPSGEYTLTLEPGQTNLNLAWQASKKSGSLRLIEGQAPLSRSPAQPTK